MATSLNNSNIISVCLNRNKFKIEEYKNV